MAGRQRKSLLELPDDLLLRIFVQLPALQERLRLAEVCRRLHALTAGPSELWREVDVQPLRYQGAGDLERAMEQAVDRFTA